MTATPFPSWRSAAISSGPCSDPRHVQDRSPVNGGIIKERPEDFFVQEIPLYEPSGEGEHVFTEIQKVGLPTFEVAKRLSRYLNVHPRDIGFAGMKDTHAVTRQVFSKQSDAEF